jgi:hypothetical protein
MRGNHGAARMKKLKLKLTAEVLYLIEEALRIEAQIKTLPSSSDYARRLRQDQHYHHQELGQHVLWAYQEQHES